MDHEIEDDTWLCLELLDGFVVVPSMVFGPGHGWRGTILAYAEVNLGGLPKGEDAVAARLVRELAEITESISEAD